MTPTRPSPRGAEAKVVLAIRGPWGAELGSNGDLVVTFAAQPCSRCGRALAAEPEGDGLAEDGASRIARERRRQIEGEGYKPEHDAGHEDGALALAGSCYAAAASRVVPLVHYGAASAHSFVDMWPWSAHDDRRKVQANYVNHLPETTEERVRFLEKAGALIAAEIDRLLRASGSQEDRQEEGT